LFVKECGKYDHEIIFSRYDKKLGNRVVSGKSIMGLLSIEAEPGKKLDIRVQNLPNTEPEKIVRRLYAGLTTDFFYPDFDRLDE
jgi:phosphotransferase system HPr-like phosphotransfer protein